ncbi:MAG: DUF2877 domain-containing protein [Candidatus Pacearchaeota archaeon]|nr:DUF2877 domain-containing protein [Candidatus Pacearchaeota archaeon]
MTTVVKDLIKINALSIDAELYKKLQEKEVSGRIHSFFSNAVNVITEGDELITVLSRGRGMCPFSLLADVDNFEGLSIEAGDTVSFDSAGISTGSFLIKMEQVFPCNLELPVFQTAPFGRKKIKHLKKLLREYVVEYPHREVLQQRVSDFLRALSGDDETFIRKSVQNLIGLGPGLTPAGDDFLAGFASTVSALEKSGAGYRKCGFMKALTAAIKEFLTRTNTISSKYLEHAVKGRLSENQIELIKSVFMGNFTDIERNFESLKNFGATSGWWLAEGIAEGIGKVTGWL